MVPDIAVERGEDGEFLIRLLDDWMPNIYISRRYMEMYRKGGDPKDKVELFDAVGLQSRAEITGLGHCIDFQAAFAETQQHRQRETAHQDP